MKKMILYVCALTALSACGNGPSDGGECGADAECKGDRICVDGACVTPDSSGDDSSDDSDSTDDGNNDSANSDPSSNSDFSPNNTTGNNTTPNNQTDDGELGSPCSSSSECDSAYCRVSAGGFEGTCAVNDFGEMCTGNDECEYGACLFRGDDDFGYCTSRCESFSDCPSFWDCEEVGNANGTYCIQG